MLCLYEWFFPKVVSQFRKGLILMRMRAVLELSNIRVMLYLLERGSARYSEILRGVGLSRGGLALALRDLQDDELVERRVKETRPIQTTYSLTAKGKEIAKHLEGIKKLIS